MISASYLGNAKILGRLGNSMFQYAFLRSRAHDLNCAYSCPHWPGDDIFDLKETKRVVSDVPQNKKFNMMDAPYGYDIKYKELVDGSEIFGHFQSPKYFDYEEVKEWYTFKPEIQKIQSNYDLQHRIGLHVRRGDYLHFKHVFNILGNDYYTKALNVANSRRIALFSDDLCEAKSLFDGSQISVLPIETNTAAEDMFLMTLCDGVIMANSSFSWWGSFLNNNQNKIFYPKNWYVPYTNPNIARNGWYCV